MTQHNIIGSEADRAGAHILVRIGRARRRLNPVAVFFGFAGGLGLVAGLIDSAIGSPVFLGLCAFAFLAIRFWPSR